MKNLTLTILFILMATIVCRATEPVSLNGKWELSFWQQPAVPVTSPADMKKADLKTIPATVPGNVELDMIAAGIYSDDLMVGNNVYRVRQYESYQWCYSRKFATPKTAKGQRVELDFGGIDCLADIWLNGQHVGSADNMLIPHSFDVTDYLSSKGDNHLQVIIRSVLAEAQNYQIGSLAYRMDASPATMDFLNIRKSTHAYGWSILPRIVSAALYRDVELRIVDPVHIKDVNWYTVWIDHNNKSADVYADFQVKVPVDRMESLQMEFTLSRNGKTVAEQKVPLLTYAARQHLRVNNAELWWPRGYGDAALYQAEVRIVEKHTGRVMDRDRRDIGLRTVALERNEMATRENPGKFCFIVNGERIFVRGTNWVPIDIFYSRETQMLPEILPMLTDLNCNLVRIWGGGLYEHDMFYDFCDRNGIMIWHDFAFACTLYPQDDDFAKKVEREVRSVVLRLRNHPSIALWCGNNESDRSLLWQFGAFGVDPNRDRISRRTIPDVLYEFDPTKPYLPSSPYHTPASIPLGQGDHILPECHLWSSAYYKDGSYTGINSAFASELGYHGSPNRRSLEKMFNPSSVYPWDGNMRWNDEWITKSVRSTPQSGATNGRVDVLTNQIGYLFGEVPRQLDEFVIASQAAQAEAFKYFVEFWRGGKPDRTGIIWWNLRDGWPILSDAVVDYYNSPKLAYRYIKNVQLDVCVFINDPVDGKYLLSAANDTRRPHQGTVKVSDLATGRILFDQQFTVAANERELLAGIPQLPGQGVLLIEYTVDGKAYKNHYLYGTPPFKLADYTAWYLKAGIYDPEWINQN